MSRRVVISALVSLGLASALAHMYPAELGDEVIGGGIIVTDVVVLGLYVSSMLAFAFCDRVVLRLIKPGAREDHVELSESEQETLDDYLSAFIVSTPLIIFGGIWCMTPLYKLELFDVGGVIWGGRRLAVLFGLFEFFLGLIFLIHALVFRQKFLARQ